MCKIKYFINPHEPDASALAAKMRNAGISFDTAPTDGPITLWVGEYAFYGPTAVRQVVQNLLDQQSTSRSVITHCNTILAAANAFDIQLRELTRIHNQHKEDLISIMRTIEEILVPVKCEGQWINRATKKLRAVLTKIKGGVKI